jgi:hypothetical protein
LPQTYPTPLQQTYPTPLQQTTYPTLQQTSFTRKQTGKSRSDTAKNRLGIRPSPRAGPHSVHSTKHFNQKSVQKFSLYLFLRETRGARLKKENHFSDLLNLCFVSYFFFFFLFLFILQKEKKEDKKINANPEKQTDSRICRFVSGFCIGCPIRSLARRKIETSPKNCVSECKETALNES